MRSIAIKTIVIGLLLGLVPAGAQGPNNDELRAQIDALRESLKLARKAIESSDLAQAKARRALYTAERQRSRLEQETKASEEDEQKNAARSLRKLQEEILLYRGRKDRELLLDTLQKLQ